MKILFDQGVPAPLQRYLPLHDVSTAYEKGWSRLRNGNLLRAAEKEGFEIFLTTDQNLRFEQNLNHRTLAVVILGTTSWPRIKLATDNILAAIETANISQFTFVEIP